MPKSAMSIKMDKQKKLKNIFFFKIRFGLFLIKKKHAKILKFLNKEYGTGARRGYMTEPIPLFENKVELFGNSYSEFY